VVTLAEHPMAMQSKVLMLEMVVPRKLAEACLVVWVMVIWNLVAYFEDWQIWRAVVTLAEHLMAMQSKVLMVDMVVPRELVEACLVVWVMVIWELVAYIEDWQIWRAVVALAETPNGPMAMKVLMLEMVVRRELAEACLVVWVMLEEVRMLEIHQ
jgi:hypothetical protein